MRLADRGVPAATVVAALRCFNQTCVTLTSGQYLDIGFESQSNISIADYQVMIEGKTAALVACACEMGGLVTSAPDDLRQHLHTFGHHLGLAFQMRDDILGIWGDPARTGKPVGADIARRKKTLPILYGLEHSEDLAALLKQDVLSANEVRLATALLEDTNSQAFVEQLIHEHHAQALAALSEANLQGPAPQALQEMAHSLLNRER
jgi:geranylgeranyl diphosphate synthase type I